MAFKEVVVGGVNLVRQAIQSPGFITGSSGWTINQDGSAEFSNIIARGSVIINPGGGTLGNGSIIIQQTGGQSQIQFDSGASRETGRAALFAAQDPADTTRSDFVHSSNVDGDRFQELTMIPPTVISGTPTLGSVGLLHGGSGAAFPNNLFSQHVVDTGFQTILQDTNTIASGAHALSIGDVANNHVRYSGSEIQAVTTSLATSTLHLQPAGSGFDCPGMRPGFGFRVANVNTTSTTFVSAGANGAFCNTNYPPSGIITVCVYGRMDGSTVAGQASLLSFEIRDLNSAGTVLQVAADQNGAIAWHNETTGTDPSFGRTITFQVSAPASGSLFCQTMFRVTGGGATGNYQQLSISVIPHP